VHVIVMPAVDLRDGACVQLVGGSYDQERVRLPDPVSVARRWRQRGFKHLHVVDLDAATGRGSNDGIVTELLSAGDADVQVGGGVRSADRLETLFALGARRVVTGTRALEEPDWLAGIAERRPGGVVAAVDVRGRSAVVRGWADRLDDDLFDVLRRLATLPLAAILVTAVEVEGRLGGPDLALIDDVSAQVDLPLIASGGIASFNDLYALRDRGVWAVVVGMALYTGTLDPDRVAKEFGE
jgi:phosphoribosylformimino-5-aminoimidazole carboxamide ribotide isomerase